MKSFVTFENGHMLLDVKGFLESDEGKRQVSSIIKASEKFSPKSVRVYFVRAGSSFEDYIDIVGNPLQHVDASLITRVEPTP